MTTLLILGLSVAFYLPIFSYFAVEEVQEKLTERGTSSPILVGYKGDQFDLTMNALYYRGVVRDPITMSVQLDLADRGDGVSVPLHVHHTASQVPIVGTSLDYFSARSLQISIGRQFAVLGEVVAGAQAAQDFQLKEGDTIRSDVTNLYNIAGAYPMILQVVGILEESQTVDDNAFFVSVQTGWALDGLLHGHGVVTSKTSLNPEAKEGENLEATAAIFLFPEITEKNRGTFHMHGALPEMPIDSVLFFPDSQKSHDQVLGFLELSKVHHAVRPKIVIENILSIVFTIQAAMNGYFLVLCCSTLAFLSLIFSLRHRLRSDEFSLMQRMGGAKNIILVMLCTELFIVSFCALLMAVLLSWGSLIGLSFLLS
jgi:putative ABC transport system permease protein